MQARVDVRRLRLEDLLPQRRPHPGRVLGRHDPRDERHREVRLSRVEVAVGGRHEELLVDGGGEGGGVGVVLRGSGLVAQRERGVGHDPRAVEYV